MAYGTLLKTMASAAMTGAGVMLGIVTVGAVADGVGALYNGRSRSGETKSKKKSKKKSTAKRASPAAPQAKRKRAA